MLRSALNRVAHDQASLMDSDSAFVSDDTRDHRARRSFCPQCVLTQQYISKCAVQTALVVVNTPDFDRTKRLVDRLKSLNVQAFVSKICPEIPTYGIRSEAGRLGTACFGRQWLELQTR